MQHLKMNASRTVALATAGAMTLGSTVLLAGPTQAASSKTWKKVAIGAAAVTGYGLIKGKGKVATIGGIATAGSYYMYKKKKKQERRRWRRR